MTDFKVHTIESAPEKSKPILEGARKALGFVPNQYAVFAESPAVLEAYTTLWTILDRSTSFTATELQVILLTTIFENECDYCMAAHTTISQMQKVPADVIEALRAGKPLADPKLEALRTYTRAVVESQGWVSEETLQKFLDAGYERRHALEVVLGVSFKIMSNFTNHVAETPLDVNFQANAWKRPTVEV